MLHDHSIQLRRIKSRRPRKHRTRTAVEPLPTRTRKNAQTLERITRSGALEPTPVSYNSLRHPHHVKLGGWGGMLASILAIPPTGYSVKKPPAASALRLNNKQHLFTGTDRSLAPLQPYPGFQRKNTCCWDLRGGKNEKKTPPKPKDLITTSATRSSPGCSFRDMGDRGYRP